MPGKVGRPKKKFRKGQVTYMKPALWEALRTVSRRRAARLNASITVPDLLEEVLMKNSEIASEVRRAEGQR